jgi:transcriptional regulator with XRE-family HTH domain
MSRRNSGHAKQLLSRNILRMRQKRGWSQHDLADEAGVRQALISSLEAQKSNPTLSSLEKVATALDVAVADLLATHAE